MVVKRTPFVVSFLPIALVLALVGATPASGQQTPHPCESAAHSQFDFWLGTWEVMSPNGQLAGTNEITKEIGACVLHERYATPAGYEGESFSIYDASRGVWHQTWVDNGGLLLQLEGGLEDGAMVLRGITKTSNGDVHQRITWSRSPDGGRNVRQHWETSPDGGKTWTTAFDGTYVPR